jgi:FkbM family methyltransferase
MEMVSGPRTAKKSYSQWGEDALVLEFFGDEHQGIFFEAGAHHPTNISQTYLLELAGWSGLLVEALPNMRDQFVLLRPQSKLVQKALGSPEQAGQVLSFIVPADGNLAEARLLGPGEKAPNDSEIHRIEVTTISAVLSEAAVEKLDYLSLDIEGHELAALRGLDFDRWQPMLILVEDHLYDLELHRFLKTKGYCLVYRLGSNNWYVPTGTHFPRCGRRMRWELIRKLYLSMPFRKLRLVTKTLRGLRV